MNESQLITLAIISLLVGAASWGLCRQRWLQRRGPSATYGEREVGGVALHHAQEFTRTLLDNLDDGVVACDAEGKLVLFNRVAREWHAADAKRVLPDVWAANYNLFGPDGVTPLPTQMIPLARAYNGEVVRDMEITIKTPGQPLRRVLASGGPFYDSTGKKLGAVVAMHDITERQLAEQALAYERHLMRTLMESVPDTIYFKDAACRFIDISRSQAEMLGASDPGQAIGKTDFDFFGVEHARAAYDDEQAIIRTGEPLVDCEELLNWPNRPSRWVSSTKLPLRDEAGRIIGTFGISRDITARKLAEEKLLYLSIHDALTGLYNRTYFEEILSQLSHSNPYPISVIVIDIDGMKLTNDTQGHPAGDELLRRTARVLVSACRKGDIIARIGGDEFAVLSPQTDSEVAASMLDSLRHKLAEHNAATPGALLSLSMGTATAYEQDRLMQTITNADQQMYRDKQEHRYLLADPARKPTDCLEEK